MNISLNGEWTLNIDNEEYKINIPSALQSLSELGEKFKSEAMPNSFLGKALLTKTFKYETPKKINTVTFNGIMPYGTVYINGVQAGVAEYCQTAFTFDVGQYLKTGENTISVVIEEENLEHMGGMRFDLLKWSGIYDDVYLSTGDIEIKEAEIKYNPENSKAVIKAYISENGVEASLSVALGDECVITQTAVSSDNAISFEIDTSSLEKWSTFNPVLYTVRIKAGGEELKFATGFRDFRCENDRLLLNGVPFYAFGGGDEYFSPTISPLRDKEIIRKRYGKIKEMGFNFYRFHTHSPTNAELEVCDELGIMVSVEIPILSNFNRIVNTEVGLKILTEYIKQTRTHPCIADYCLGNEGVQLLVKNEEEHKVAIEGYNTVKENTSYQLAMMCFGYQGEVPSLNNDIMTPHLWSHEFRWAYQGLAKTPWSFIKGTLSNKPCIVHEFGKYGVWPDDEEDNYWVENGYQMSNKKHNDELFENSGLEKDRKRIIKNSKKLSTLCARTAFESMRRNSGISGYVYWTMFRMGIRAGGLCDDLGMKSDCDADILKTTANAPLGLFCDRDYSGRTFNCGEEAEFNITVSNFSQQNIKDALLTVALKDSDGEKEKITKTISADMGEISVSAKLECAMPQYKTAKDLTLEMTLSDKGKILSKNDMTLWCYPNKKINSDDRIVYHLHNADTEKNLKSCINTCVDLWSWISILTGCVIPEYGFMPSDDKILDYMDIAARKMKPSLVICDQMDEVSDKLTSYGIPVLYIDSGNFPKELYPEIIPGNSFYDLNRFYAPFRTSWDEGNSATLIDGDIFGDVEDFADLRWYSCIEDSIALLKNKLTERLGIEKTENSIRLIQRIKDKVKISKNSTVYFEKTQKRCINECVYYIDGKVGDTRVAVVTMNLFGDACGRYALGKIIENLLKNDN